MVEVDVPERPDSRALLQLIVDACSRISLGQRGRTAMRIARPAIEKAAGRPGDSARPQRTRAGPAGLPARAILSLPVELARGNGKRALVFLDELQRVVDYADGEDVLRDLVDIYGASERAVVLVDGSGERARGHVRRANALRQAR